MKKNITAKRRRPAAPAKVTRTRLTMVQILRLGQIIERNADKLTGRSYEEMQEIIRPLVDFEFAVSSIAGLCRELGIPSSRDRNGGGTDALYGRIARLEERLAALTAEVENLKNI